MIGAILSPVLGAGMSTWLRYAGFAYVVGVAKDALESVLESGGVKEAITKIVNDAVAQAGVPGLHLRDVFDVAATKSDAYSFAIGLIQDKIGADFSDVDFETVEKDEILLRLSRVIRDRINTEAGAQLGDIWPVETAKTSIENEIVRQFTDGFTEE